MPQTIEPARPVHVKLLLVLLVAAAFIALAVLHRPQWLNGPWYHDWQWRRLPWWPLWPLMLLAAVPALVGSGMYSRKPSRVGIALVLLMASTLAMQWIAVTLQPASPGRHRAEEIVEHGVNTSYYSSAKVILEQEALGISKREWMGIYPELQEKYLVFHSKYKPPGLIFFYQACIGLAGPEVAGRYLAAGIISVLAALGIVSTYWLVRILGQDEPAAFHAASYLALIPSLTLFLPQFDQAYVPITAAVLISWAVALQRGRAWQAILFGGLMAGCLMLTYGFLMLGAFLVLYAVAFMMERGRPGVERFVRQSVIATLTIGVFYAALWIAADFNAWAVFLTAGRLSQAHLVELRRPWPLHNVYDVWDIALGLGVVALPLLGMGLRRVFRTGTPLMRRLTLIGLGQVALSIAVAVFPGENARLMLFLMPLLLPAVGCELAAWPTKHRVVVLATLAVITIVVCQNMTFLIMPADR